MSGGGRRGPANITSTIIIIDDDVSKLLATTNEAISNTLIKRCQSQKFAKRSPRRTTTCSTALWWPQNDLAVSDAKGHRSRAPHSRRGHCCCIRPLTWDGLVAGRRARRPHRTRLRDGLCDAMHSFDVSWRTWRIPLLFLADFGSGDQVAPPEESRQSSGPRVSPSIRYVSWVWSDLKDKGRPLL